MTKRGFIPLALICLLGSGCAREEQPVVLHERIQAKRDVPLPAKPSFNQALENAKPTRDGVYSTWGAIFHQKELLDSTIRLRGEVTEISADCPEITQPQPKKKGKRPAAVPVPNSRKCRNLTVTISSPETMTAPIMLTGYHPFYHPHFKTGMEIDVTGKYVLFDKGLVSSQNGILVVDSFHNIGVNAEGHFTANRVELNKMITKGECL